MMRFGGNVFWNNHMYYGMERYWPYGMIIFAVIAIVLVVVGISLIKRRQKNVSYSEALDILNKRYVNGEIDEDTYLRMKKTIV